MGILAKIKDATHRQLYQGYGAHFRLRGLVVPLDPFSTGKVRFAQKVHFQMPLIVPDNRWYLDEEAVYQTDQLILDRDPAWLRDGSFISVGNRELHRVEDVSDNTVILATRLLADHPERQSVYHYSHPITVEGAYAAGATVINVDAAYFMSRGDMLGISYTSGETDPMAFTPYEVSSLVYIGQDVSDEPQYQVTLDKPLHRALTDGETIQLRAYPAYQSKILNVPQSHENPELAIVGPYLIDWVSAPTMSRQTEVVEFQTLQRYTDAQTFIGSRLAIEKNHVILFVPIRADQLLFWNEVAGTMQYRGDVKKTVAVADDDGHWRIRFVCTPNMEVPYTNARGLIVTVPVAQLQNNDGFRPGDDVEFVQFEYQVDGTYVATPSAAATGSVTVNAIPLDNTTITLDDGFTTPVVFEFQRTAGFTASSPTNKVVDVQAAVGFTDVAVALEAAVMAVTTLGITAVNVGAIVNFTNTRVSLNGNVAIVLGGLAWPTVGMAGGTDRVETIDVSSVTTAIEVAQLTAAALNRAGLHMEASWPTVANATQLLSTVQGTGGNIPITETVLDAGFVVNGMSGGTGGTAWHFEATPEANAVVRVRLYPNDWQTYTFLAGTTNTVTVQLDPTDAAVERIDFLIKTTAGAETLIGGWNINGARVSRVQHTYMARVQGDYNYMSTSLLAKPYFRSLDDIRLRFDTGGVMNGGNAMVW